MKKYLLCFFVLSIFLFGQTDNKYFGVQTHFGQYYRADMDSANVIRMLDSISSAGITLIRDECYWSNVETVRGVYTFPPQIDFYISQARARNIDVLLILNYNNPLYAAHAGSSVQTDSNRIAFANYCKKVVERYSPLGVKLYEIWNEPNIPLFWDPQPNAQDYAKLLQAAYPAVKSVDSSVTVLGCATSPAEGNPSPFINWLSFITQVKNYGGLNFLDAVSIHLYRVDKAPEQFLQTDLNNLNAIITNRSVWITEIGYPTSTTWPNLSLENQSKYISRLYLLARNYPQIKSICYYDLKNDGEDAANNEHNFGLLNFNLSHKPAFDGLRTVISETKNKSLVNASINDNFYKFTFQNIYDKNYCVWSCSSDAIKTELFAKNILRIVNLDGSSFYIYDEDKSLNIGYSLSPKFITELDSFPSAPTFKILPALDTLVAGQKLQLSFRGRTVSGENIIVDSLAVNWQNLDTLSLVDSLGRLTTNYPGITTIKATLGNYVVQKSFVILLYFSLWEIESFNTMNNFTTAYFNLDSTTSLAIVDTNFTTASSSLLIDYKFKYIAIDKHRVIFNSSYNLFGTPDSIEIDIYNNGNSHVFGIVVEDADGDLFSKTTQPSNLGSGFGWKNVRIPLTGFGSNFNYPIKLKSFTIYLVKNSGVVDSIYSGRILIDNLKIHKGMILGSGKKHLVLPKEIILHQNYPNPFNPSTKIKFTVPPLTQSLSRGEMVILRVYDILGREVATLVNEELSAGDYEVEFDTNDRLRTMNYQLSTNIYFYQLRFGEFIETKKMVYLK